MNTKIYITAAAIGLLIIGVLAGHLWSNHRIRKLEQTVETAKSEAGAKKDAALLAERTADEYKQKIEYLESQLAGLRSIASKQDEELEKLKVNTDGARRDVQRVRGLRSIAVTNDELCAKLAEVGHPCQQPARY